MTAKDKRKKAEPKVDHMVLYISEEVLRLEGRIVKLEQRVRFLESVRGETRIGDYTPF